MKIIIPSIFFFIFVVPFVNSHVISDEYIVARTSVNINDSTITILTKLYYNITNENETFNYINHFNKKTVILNNGKICKQDYIDAKNSIDYFYYNSSYKCSENIENLNLTYGVLIEILPSMTNYIALNYDNITKIRTININNQNINIKISQQEIKSNFKNTIQTFTNLGVKHILSGIDHILFILATIISISQIRRVIKLITAFTIAHSITLIAASLKLINLTSTIVEPIIALSIVYMAYSNISDKKFFHEINNKWKFVFTFGLIHGLGFAGALKEIKIPEEHFIVALLSFNIGVEIGQILIILIAVPIFNKIKKTKYRKPFIFYSSFLLGLIALYWLIIRMFF